jgi:hypothetical protein
MTQEVEQFRVTSDLDEIELIKQQNHGPLADIYFSRDGQKSMKWLHYLDLYDRYLSAYRTGEGLRSKLGTAGPLRVLEIGVADGGSFDVWRRYFGPEAVIFGIDIIPECRERVAAMGINCHARIGSQADPEFLLSVVEEMGGIDIVIDDGSHIAEHQLASFRTLFPLVSNGGLYICEDLHTAYWPDWQGGHKRPGTFIEVVKDMIDAMHKWYWPLENDLSDMNLHRHITGVHLHDSMVVVEKNAVSSPLMIIK